MDTDVERYAAIVSTMDEGVLIQDTNGRIEACNESAERILGITADQLAGMTLTDPHWRAVHEDGRKLLEEENPAKVTLRTRQPVIGLTIGVRAPDGSLRWISTNSRAVYRHGEPQSVVTTMTDLTGQRAAEQALRAAESAREKFRAVFSNGPDALYLATLEEGRILDVNDAFVSLFGYAKEEVIGRTSLELGLYGNPSDRTRLVAELNATGRVSDVELKGRKKTGESFLASLSIVTMALGGKTHIAGAVRDITPAKLAENRLRESEERFAVAFRSSPAALTLSDVDDGIRIIDVSDSFERVSGYRRNEVVGLSPVEFGYVDPADFAEARKRLLEGHTLRDFEFRFRRKDGEIRSGLFSADWVDIQGRKCSLASHIDITDRRLTEQALKESAELYRLLAENVLDVIWVLDTNTFRFRYMSPSVERLLGFKAEEILTRDPLTTVTPASAKFLEQVLPDRIESFKRGGQHLYTDEIEQPCRNGSTVWVEVTSRYVINEQNGHLEVYGVSRDVTERKRVRERLQISEQMLRESSEHYLKVANCIPDTIWSMDLSGRFSYVSPSVERMYGWTVEEALKRSRLEVVTPHQAVRSDLVIEEELKRAASPQYDRNKVLVFESEQLRKDGTTLWVEINASFNWSEDGRPTGLTGVARDITERKKTEADRERLRAQLAQARKMESIGRLAGGVAHDFNNQLTVINGYCGLALAMVEAENPLRSLLDEIRKSGDRAARLTRQLLAFSRKQILKPRVLDLNRLVADMESMLRSLLGEDVELRIALGPKNPVVNADPHQLEQVIMNLVVNARHAMPDGGTLIIETALLHADGPNESSQALLAVSDTGVGMDEATREQIFEPFFTTKRVGEGTGLGLAMVEGIVAQSGGHIDVDSELGQGTTFKIYLPALAETPVSGGGDSASIEDLRGTETILVVEDQADVRGFVITALTQHGYKVLEAANAEEALAICKRDGRSIQLLLTDVVMPHMSGRELVDHLAELGPEIKVLYMSGYTDSVVMQHRVREEDVHFIQKPFGPEDLARKVRSVLKP